MDINTFVTLQHYKSKMPLKGKIVTFHNSSVSIKFLDFENFEDLSKGDPVVLYFSSEGKVCAGTGVISNFDLKKKTATLSMEKFDYLEEKRLFERFPLSKPCSIKIGQSLTAHPAIMRNISFNGLMVICEADFPVYQKLKVTFDLKHSIELYTIVTRKGKVSPTQTEYGLKINYIDEKTPKIIKHYLFKLKNGEQS